MVKLQLMTNMSANTTTPKGKMYDTVIQMLIVLFIGIIDDICKAFPAIVQMIRNMFTQRITSVICDKMPTFEDELCNKSVLLGKRHGLNTISLSRVYVQDKGGSTSNVKRGDDDASEMNHMVDAILSYVARLDNVPMMCLIPNGHFMISYKEKPIQITKDIYMKIEDITHDDKTGNVHTIRMLLMSNTLSASDITKYVHDVYAAYQEELKNSLGKHIYYFDQKVKDSIPPQLPSSQSATQEEIKNYRQMRVHTAPKQLSFTMTPFHSNKRFNNIFGSEVRTIQKRVEFFVHNREWYDEKGIPYQLGLMLSGLPGTGKTSIIRAIANMTKRHIINVNFSNITTATQLKNLFYNDKIVVYTDTTMSETKSYFIPIDQRLYVFEEVDAIGNILKQRDNEQQCSNPIVQDELTLGDILTILDGTMEIPGRMFIMTSNHPEVLDRALLRPGRIDLNVKFGYATRALIVEMYEAYLDAQFPKERIYELPDSVLTAAEISDVIMRYCKCDVDVDAIINGLQAFVTLPKETASPPITSCEKKEDDQTPPSTPSQQSDVVDMRASSDVIAMDDDALATSTTSLNEVIEGIKKKLHNRKESTLRDIEFGLRNVHTMIVTSDASQQIHQVLNKMKHVIESTNDDSAIYLMFKEFESKNVSGNLCKSELWCKFPKSMSKLVQMFVEDVIQEHRRIFPMDYMNRCCDILNTLLEDASLEDEVILKELTKTRHLHIAKTMLIMFKKDNNESFPVYDPSPYSCYADVSLPAAN